MPSNEDIIEGLKNIKAYEAKVQYVMKNDKGEETEETKQWYSADKGVRVEFGDEVTKVYKDEKIYVKDTINNNEYELGQDMDIVHPLAFINNILAYPIKEGSISEGQEEWGDTIYIKADVELFLNNIYFNKATIFIDKKNRVPIGIVVYDREDRYVLKIIYEQFEEVQKIDDSLLWYRIESS